MTPAEERAREWEPENLGDAIKYIAELETILAYQKRQTDVWRGIAAAMGYEPNSHKNVRPKAPWLLERIENFRRQVQLEAEREIIAWLRNRKGSWLTIAAGREIAQAIESGLHRGAGDG